MQRPIIIEQSGHEGGESAIGEIFKWLAIFFVIGIILFALPALLWMGGKSFKKGGGKGSTACKNDCKSNNTAKSDRQTCKSGCQTTGKGNGKAGNGKAGGNKNN